MPNIYDVVTAADTKSYYENTERPAFLGETLFPKSKQFGLELSFLKGRGGVPVILQPASFDALAPLRDRIGIESFSTEMPLFRERMLITEKERQLINTFLAGNRTKEAEILIKKVFDDAKVLIDGAQAIQEVMRMQLLSKGKIAVQATAEGRAVNYDYNLSPDQFETLVGTDAWTHADADPLANIEEYADKVKAKRVIMNSFTFGLLRKHPKVIDAVSGAVKKSFITKNDVITYFKSEFDLSIALYDEEFAFAVGGASEKFFPDYVVTFIPNGTLGETVYGTTPEESDLLTGGTDAEVEIVDKGIAVTAIKVPHPVNVQTVVSEIVLPSFPHADKIFIATVGA